MRNEWSVWTSYLHELPVVEAIRELGGLGLKYLELSAEHMNEVMAMERGEEWLDQASSERALSMARRHGASAREVRGEADGLGVRLVQAHGPFDLTEQYPRVFSDWVEKGLKKLEAWLNCYGVLGVEVAVLHPFYLGGDDLPGVNVKFFRRAARMALDRGISIALENRVRAERYGSKIGQLLEVIEGAGGEGLGICLDTGHANIEVYRGRTAEAVLESNGWLVATHIDDNDGSGDQHLLPGKGTIDWPSVVRAFREVGYEGTLNLEIPGECAGSSIEERKDGLKSFLTADPWRSNFAHIDQGG